MPAARSRRAARRIHPPSAKPTRGGHRGRFFRKWTNAFLTWRKPRGAGVVASLLLVVATIAYGSVKGGHVPAIVDELAGVRDALAGAAGFRITGVAVTGNKQLTAQEIVRAAGITDHTSLIFLDVEAARAGMKAHPWIADATIRKLYPDRLEVTITERDAFALWQKDGKISVIAADGTVTGPLIDPRFAVLPLVVGEGAAVRAKDFLTILERYPLIRNDVRAAVLVAERRWNLRLKNGIDVRLPEKNVDAALVTLTTLVEEKRLLDRDISAVDLRLADRVTVRLSEDAAKAREEAFKDKEKKTKRKGGDA